MKLSRHYDSFPRWPNGAIAMPAHLVPTEAFPKPCEYPVSIYKNDDGSWYAAHFHGGRHDGMKHPVTEEQVDFD
jgi:hypothetical protein